MGGKRAASFITEEDLEVLESGSEDKEKSPEEESAQRKAQLERAELRLETKEKVRKDPILVGIESLDVNASLDEQQEALSNLEAVLDELILLALKAGEKKEDLAKSPLLIQKYAESEVQKAAIQKLSELIQAQSEFSVEWWSRNLDDGTEQYAAATKEKERIEKKERPEKPDWMSPGVKASLIAAGAIGGFYFLYKWFKSEKGEKKTSDLAIGAGLAAIGVGTLVGSESLGKWSADYLNLSLSSETTKDSWELFKKGEIWEGLKAFVFSSREPGVKKAAEKIGIPERIILDLKDTKWSDFSGFRADAARSGKSFFYSGLEAAGLGNMPGVSLDEHGERAREEIKLESFIKRHEDKVGTGIHGMTIGEILNTLEKKGVFGEPENPDQPEGETDTGTGSGTEGVPESKEDLSAFPHVSAAIEGMRNGDLSWDEGLAEVMAGAVEDGGGIGIMDGMAVLVKGAAIVPLSSANIVIGQLQDLGAAFAGTGEWKDVLFEKDQLWWFGGYAAFHGAKVAISNFKAGKFSLSEVGVGAAKGGFQGIIDSYLMLPKLAIRGMKWKEGATLYGNYLKFSAKENLPFLSVEEQVHLMHKESAYFAERYTGYFDEVQAAKKAGGGLKKAKAWVYEKLFGKEWMEQMMLRSGKRYLEAYAKFCEKMGIPNVLDDISPESLEAGADIRARLAKSAREFATNHPETGLPRIAGYRVMTPKFKTHAEARAAGMEKLKPTKTQWERMKRLGLDHERITLRLREYGFKKADIEKLLTELESSPNPTKTAKDLEVLLWKIKNPRLFAAAGGFAKAAGILGTLYMLYDFQESKDKWNTAGETGTMLGSFALGARAGMAVVPHPIGKVVAGFVGGLAFSFGGQAAWNSYGRPKLQKYFPNRQEFFENPALVVAGNYLSLMTGGLFINSLLYGADAMGLGDGIDEETDPLHYLQDSKYTWHPDFAKEMMAGKRWWPYGDHRMHDLDDLRSNAKEAHDETTEEITELDEDIAEMQKDLSETEDLDRKETLEIEIEEAQKKHEDLNRLLLVYQSYMDDSWLEVKKMELIFVQTEMIEPAFEKFQRLAKAKFGDEGLEAFNRLIGRVQQAREGVKGEKEMEVWQYLCDESITTGAGEEVSFPDFITMAITVYRDAEFLGEVEKDLSLQKSEPLASGEGVSEQEAA